MLDSTYSYNPYQDHDEDNETHYRYHQSAELRKKLELPELTHPGRSELRSERKTANCLGFPRPGAEADRGFDIKDMFKPKGLNDTIFTQMSLVQFGADSNELVITVLVTQGLTSCAEDLDNVSSKPEALPDICSHLFHCSWHVYSFLRDIHFVGVLVNRVDSTISGNVWYVDSFKSDGSENSR